MIVSKIFGFPSEEGLFPKIIDILMNEYGLVDGKFQPTKGDTRVLVWEDENNIGRYRVHCYGNDPWKLPNYGDRWDFFNFHYWINQERFDRTILSKDPMNKPLQQILSLSINRYDTDLMYVDKSIDELAKYI